MTHLLVQQLRYARSEWSRGFEGVSPEEAVREFEHLNSLSWMMGRMAWFEQLYWLQRAQGKTLVPELAHFGYGQPISAPPLDEVSEAWREVTAASDAYLDTLTPYTLQARLCVDGLPARDCVGTYLMRVNYNYWYHLGEAQTVRRLLGHTNLPIFIGEDISRTPYHPEFA